VKYELQTLISWGLEQDAEVVMFGHTHTPCLKYEQNMTILNPGSISLPRQEPHVPTFTMIEIDKKGEIHIMMNEFRG
jgi:putative phosphoesterase